LLGDLTPNACNGLENRFVDLLNDMKDTDLMWDRTKYLQNRTRIQRGAVGGDPKQSRPAFFHLSFETLKESDNVLMFRVVIKNLKHQSPISSIVYQRQQAGISIIQFIDGDVAGEVEKHVVEIPVRHQSLRFFFPKPQPSFEWCLPERRRSGRATYANWRNRRAIHPRQQSGLLFQPPIVCNEVLPEPNSGIRHGNRDCTACNGAEYIGNEYLGGVPLEMSPMSWMSLSTVRSLTAGVPHRGQGRYSNSRTSSLTSALGRSPAFFQLVLRSGAYSGPFIKPSSGNSPRKGTCRGTKKFHKISVNLLECLCSYHIIETHFNKTPITEFSELPLIDRLLAYLNYENSQITQILLNEAIINELIVKVYELSSEDRLQVETKMGKPVGEMPVLAESVNQWIIDNGQLTENEKVKEFVKNLSIATFDDVKIREIKDGFTTLYQSNNGLEEFCIRHQINPINVWYWFKEAKVLPQARAAEIVLEFLADAIRTILAEDDDGIIPLVGLPGEPRLLDRLEKHCLDKGFTSAQFMQLDGLLGRPLSDYLEHNFFKDLSDHLNLFMYLPKTPFIWHLSSGEHQGLEVYISIYKWSRDNLFRLKTAFISKRIENLEYRQIQLKDSDTAQAQSEKETIRLQLQEITEFTKKIEELIAEGYDPKLDDGVGKNIAPLQKKGLLQCDVLNAKQLDKYLKADW
jgi:Leucine-rich repeat (LRR) protein